ncbi:MAG: beta-Ala-His dipeptidase, partial [Spirochaetales bacterium]|nr:beta-Ala-His dipeptidase [Spirochaetales bacterium]
VVRPGADPSRPGADPSRPGAESSRPTVVIQGHLDMVCEKNMGVEHDFERDPIRLVLDGEWLHAQDTTLGADNGIAVAMMLAVLELDDDRLPTVECLFTVDEETGLVGALALDSSLISGRVLINLDSEEEGFFCIGCAGGLNTYATLPLVWQDRPASSDAAGARVTLTGLQGGHSGVNIHEERGNSIVLGARLLQRILEEIPDVAVSNLAGGNKHNAIPRELTLDLVVPSSEVERLTAACRAGEADFVAELGKREPTLAIAVEATTASERTIAPSSARTVADLLVALSHGVFGMSHEVDDLVETSNNVAAVTVRDGDLSILTSQRSSRSSLIDWASQRISAAVRLAGGTTRTAERYPAWTPSATSPLLAKAQEVHRRVAGKDAQVIAIHAGLECGVIGDKLGDMDMISFGPDMVGVHTPEERLNVGSTERTWNLLVELLRSL